MTMVFGQLRGPTGTHYIRTTHAPAEGNDKKYYGKARCGFTVVFARGSDMSPDEHMVTCVRCRRSMEAANNGKGTE